MSAITPKKYLFYSKIDERALCGELNGPALKCNLCGELTEWEQCMGIESPGAAYSILNGTDWVKVLCTHCYWMCVGAPGASDGPYPSPITDAFDLLTSTWEMG